MANISFKSSAVSHLREKAVKTQNVLLLLRLPWRGPGGWPRPTGQLAPLLCQPRNETASSGGGSNSGGRGGCG